MIFAFLMESGSLQSRMFGTYVIMLFDSINKISFPTGREFI